MSKQFWKLLIEQDTLQMWGGSKAIPNFWRGGNKKCSGQVAEQDKALQSCNRLLCQLPLKSSRVWFTTCFTRADSTGEEKGGVTRWHLPSGALRRPIHTHEAVGAAGAEKRAPAKRGKAGSPLRGRSRASCHSPTAWPPLLPGHWFGEYSLGSTPGVWPGLRYATTAQIKSSVKTGLAEHSAEQWMLFPISQLEHLSLGAVHYITCPGHFLGRGVMEQVFPCWALSYSPGTLLPHLSLLLDERQTRSVQSFPAFLCQNRTI